jgi:hypothetical protein
MKKISLKGQRWLKGFHSFFACFGTFQATTLIFAVFITALKPWKKKRKIA